MQLIWCLLSNFYLNMFRASLCPSSGEQECALPHMVFCTGCAGCGCVELGRHHNQCRTPYAAVHSLVLLMMGIMVSETCWDKSLIINIRLVAPCWFLSLNPMHGHKNLRLGETECIKTAEDILQWPVLAICNKIFVSEKSRVFLAWYVIINLSLVTLRRKYVT